MISFFIAIILLWGAYFTYGKLIEKIFGANSTNSVPSITKFDGVDYIPLPKFKTFLIQFLNITGLGPIFGAILGAMWGPISYLWIVFGCIFIGAMHDYMSGMISVRHDGASLPELTGKYLGKFILQFSRIFTLILMILVGAIFVTGPAGILANLGKNVSEICRLQSNNILTQLTFWAALIFVYYFIATVLPINKIIGRIYPFFGAILLLMAISLTFAILLGNYRIPEFWEYMGNFHLKADKMPILPMMFITIACGAISGFHATQSPLMARCIKNEKEGRWVFYGAMVAEGTLALIWATIAMSFYGGVENLNTVLFQNNGNAAIIVNEVSKKLLGNFGMILAILGVVFAPITSGDTALRSARLLIADALNINQKNIKNRLLVAIFIFSLSFVLTIIKFDVLWRYMAWSNQTLATFTLWMITVYLIQNNKNYFISLIPALFMTFSSSTYIFFAPEGFQLNYYHSLTCGAIITITILIILVTYIVKKGKKNI
ncbi:MAG: carbon starvation protein A [Bacteroidales bacterium]|nr:carbon starvation protein A [Bacteroidales bacterium]